MFFETTFFPSPQLSAGGLDDSVISDILSPTKEVPYLSDLDAIEETPINHLVFVIHGIGQQTEQNGYFYENIKNLQETTRQVLQAKMPDRNVRIELIPIEWHRHIHDQVDPTMNRITLKTIPTIRFIENDYLADVLFYFTKDRGQAIIDNVTQLFNTSYSNFMEKHPSFNGKIVIFGYSLGGILIWDILSHQRKPSTVQEEWDYSKLDVIYSKLDFKPDYFFSLGSPIAAVLTIRNQSPVTYHPDHDITFENIFHPFDPLAYRMEPLFDDYYTYQPAMLVERSVPIGPSFSLPSLPSLPSFPSIDLMSFFSWKMSSAGNVGVRNDNHSDSDTTPINHNDTMSTAADQTIMDAYDASYRVNHKHLVALTSSSSSSSSSAAAAAAAAAAPSAPAKTSAYGFTNTSLMQSAHHHHNQPTTTILENGHLLEKGIMHRFLKYFGKHRRHSDNDKNDIDDGDLSKNKPIVPDINEDPAHQMVNANSKTHGIITCNPLQEQRHADFSADGKSQGPFWKTLMETSDLAKKSTINIKNNSRDATTHLTRSISSTSSSSSSSSSSTTLSSTTIISRQGTRQRSQTYSVGDKRSIPKCESGTDTTLKNSNHQHHLGQNYNSIGNDNTSGKSPSTYFRYLVNALGLDSVTMESFESAPFNISRHSSSNSSSNSSNLPRQDIHQTPDTDENRDRSTPSINRKRQAGNHGLTTQMYDAPIYSAVNNAQHTPAATGPVNSLIMETTPTTANNNNNNNSNKDNDDDTKRFPHQELEEAEKLTAPMSKDDTTNINTRAQQQYALKHLPGHRRMDFSLQPDGLMSMIANEYLVGLRAHFSYWTSKDMMWHILQALEK